MTTTATATATATATGVKRLRPREEGGEDEHGRGAPMMRGGSGPPSVGPPTVRFEMHRENRLRVARRLLAGSRLRSHGGRHLLLVAGGSSRFRDETDHEEVFRQESSFQYLFGVREPDCFATIAVDAR